MKTKAPAKAGTQATGSGSASTLPRHPDVLGIARALLRASDAFLGILRHEVNDGRTIDVAEGIVLGFTDLVEQLGQDDP